MDWGIVLAIVVGWFVIAGALVWLGKAGKIGNKDVALLSTVMSSIDVALKAISESAGTNATNVMSLITTLVTKAVQAAENAYYNNVIDAEERTNYCIARLTELLAAANIVLTDAQVKVVNTLIAAACEEMGHGLVQEKEDGEV